ncbi:MAG: hypothetical protein JXJ20_14965 [Anaerolineae bacterium]|nr:hypothetical protein [Anaerolineae bacterium]
MQKFFVVFLCGVVVLTAAPAVYAQEPPEVVNDALKALSEKLGVTITISDVSQWYWEQKNFPDASLDCPLPDQTYAQVQTNGYIVQLVYNGVLYDYRITGNRQTIFLCKPDGGAPGGTETPATATPTFTPTAIQVQPAAPTITPVPALPSGTVACPGGMPARLAVGMAATSITNGSVNIRSTPGLGDPNTVIGLLLPGGEFDVVDGPQCASGQTWWRISYDTEVGNTTGWVMEGDAEANEYWLGPLGGAPVAPEPATTLIPITSANAGQVRQNMQLPMIDGIRRVAFMPPPSSDALIVTQAGELAYYSGTTAARLATLGHRGASIQAVAVGPREGGSATMATAEEDAASSEVAIWVWEVRAGNPPAAAELYGVSVPDVNALMFSPDGRWLAASSGMIHNEGRPTDPNGVWVWDVQSGTQIATLPHDSPAVDLVFSADGARLAVTLFPGRIDQASVMVWDLTTQMTLFEVSCQAGWRGTPTLAFSPDGSLLAAGTEDGKLLIWEAATGVLRHEIIVSADMPVLYVTFSPDGSLVAAADAVPADGMRTSGIGLWDAATGAQVAALADHAEQVTGLVFRDGGGQLVAPGTLTWFAWGVF